MVNFTGINAAKHIPKCKEIANFAQKTPLPDKAGGDSFTSRNLFHFLKKKLYTVDEITDFAKKLSDEEKYIGCLPDKWRKSFPESEVREKTKQIQKLFSEFAKNCSTRENTPIKTLAPEVEKLRAQLEELFGECKIDRSFKGSLGKVFLIDCGSEKVALKIFHNNPNPKHLAGHGQTKEIANAVFLSNNLKPNQSSRFYCGKIGLSGDNDAFMLTEYVTPKIAGNSHNHWALWDCSRFYNGDYKGDNIINGKIIDYGGIHYNFENLNQKAYAKELFPLIQGGKAKEVSKLIRKYRGDSDFDAILNRAKEIVETQIDSPYSFAVSVNDGYFTKKQVDAFKALGVDFSGFKNFETSNESLISALENVGLKPRKNNMLNMFTNFIKGITPERK